MKQSEINLFQESRASFYGCAVLALLAQGLHITYWILEWIEHGFAWLDLFNLVVPSAIAVCALIQGIRLDKQATVRLTLRAVIEGIEDDTDASPTRDHRRV